MVMKSERVELRLDPELVENIDSWRRQEADLPSKSEAIRRLVQQGLSSSSKQSYMVMKTQIMLAAKQANSESFLSDASVFAWANDVFPAFNSTSEALAEPFQESFIVTKEMIEKLGKYIDQAWLKRSWFTYYELEDRFTSPEWDRGKLIIACQYMHLNRMFSGFWEHFMPRGEYPIEAKGITEPFDRTDLFIA